MDQTDTKENYINDVTDLTLLRKLPHYFNYNIQLHPRVEAWKYVGSGVKYKKADLCIVFPSTRKCEFSVCGPVFFFRHTATMLTATDKQLSVIGKYLLVIYYMWNSRESLTHMWEAFNGTKSVHTQYSGKACTMEKKLP